MAILSVVPEFSGRSSTRDLESFNKSYKHEYIVLVDDEATTDDEIYADPRVPQRGQAHPNNVDAIAKKVSQKEDPANNLIRRIEVEYSTSTSELGPYDAQELPPPVFDLPKVSWDMNVHQEVAEKGYRLQQDSNAKLAPIEQVLVASSAGEVFEQPTYRDVAVAVARVRRNETVPPPLIAAFINAANTDTFTVDSTTIQPYQAKLNGIRIGPTEQRGPYKFRPVDYEIHFRPDGWITELLDHGYHKHNTSSGQEGGFGLHMITDKKGQPVQKPVLLDGSGQPHRPDDTVTDVDKWNRENAVFLRYLFYEELPFSVLNFPIVT